MHNFYSPVGPLHVDVAALALVPHRCAATGGIADVGATSTVGGRAHDPTLPHGGGTGTHGGDQGTYMCGAGVDTHSTESNNRHQFGHFSSLQVSPREKFQKVSLPQSTPFSTPKKVKVECSNTSQSHTHSHYTHQFTSDLSQLFSLLPFPLSLPPSFLSTLLLQTWCEHLKWNDFLTMLRPRFQPPPMLLRSSN